MDYYNSYNYTYGNTDPVLAGVLAIYMIILVLCFLFYVISYVFKGIGMYTIAKRQGMDYPWLAFVPFARTYLHGELGGSITLKSKSIKNPGIWLLAMPFIFGAVNFIFYMILVVMGMGAMFSSIPLDPYAEPVMPHIGTGVIMGIIVIAILWILAAVLYQALYVVFRTLVNQQILEKFTTKNMSIAHAVLCNLIPLYESICLFAMRNKKFNLGMEPDLGTPFMQPVPPVPPVIPLEVNSEPEPHTAAEPDTAEADTIEIDTVKADITETEQPQGSGAHEEDTTEQDHPDTTE